MLGLDRSVWAGGRNGRLARIGAMRARRGRCLTQPEPDELIELTVIVPARNEEAEPGRVPAVAGGAVGGDF